MFRKIGLLLGVAACGALVTSCGGGNNNEPTPTPTDTSTATPTPTPTSAVDFDLSAGFETASANFNTIAAWFTPTGGTETFNDASRINGPAAISLAFSPELVRFRFPDQTSAVQFDNTHLVSSTTTSRTYQSGDETLSLLKPFSHVLQVNYRLDNQAFIRDTVNGTLRSQRRSLFINPVTTTDAIASNLTYTGSVQVVGGDPGVTQSGSISAPDVTFTINQADSSISGTIEIFEIVSGTQQLVATLVFERTNDTNGNATGGVLNTNGTFSGTLTDSANNLAGSFSGTLAGPNREELSLIFAVIDSDTTDTDETEFVGSFIGD